MKELNQMFNLKKMITLVKELKSQLLQYQTEGQKCEVFLTFSDNLNDG